MNTARKVIGTHAFFFPEGAAFTSPEAGTASKTAKPDGDEATWRDLGVSDWTASPQNTVTDFFAPSPGMRQLDDRIVTKRGLMMKGKMMQISNLLWRSLMGLSSDFPSTGVGGQYNPLEGDPVVRGWLQLQQYDQNNTLFNTVDVYVAMEIPGDVEFGENPVDINVEARVLFSTLNTGTLA